MRRSFTLARLLVAGLLVVLLIIGAPALSVDSAQIAAQVTDLEDEVDEAPGLGVITGTPDPGPDPEDAGDRGGFAQLTVAIVLISAIAFISSRVIKGARSSG